MLRITRSDELLPLFDVRSICRFMDNDRVDFSHFLPEFDAIVEPQVTFVRRREQCLREFTLTVR